MLRMMAFPAQAKRILQPVRRLIIQLIYFLNIRNLNRNLLIHVLPFLFQTFPVRIPCAACKSAFLPAHSPQPAEAPFSSDTLHYSLPKRLSRHNALEDVREMHSHFSENQRTNTKQADRENPKIRRRIEMLPEPHFFIDSAPVAVHDIYQRIQLK